MKTINTHKLSTTSINALQPGMHSDGLNLYLQVSVNAVTNMVRRSWLYRYRVAGKTRDMGLGGYPKIGLSNARKLAEAQAKIIQEGKDPITERNRLRGVSRDADPKTRMNLKRTVATYISMKKSNWNKQQKDKWEEPFIHHVYPKYGNAHINEIDDEIIRQILEPIWNTKNATAKKLRRKLEAVLAWAAYMNYRPKGQNPATWKDALDTHFHNNSSTNNRPALPFSEVPAFIHALVERNTIASYAFRFLVLTAARTDDALNAKWDQIKGDVWWIPGRGTNKMNKDFPIPLSTQAMAILNEMKTIRTGEYIFPGQDPHGGLSSNVLRATKDYIGYSHMTPHGCRSSFRSWCDDETEADHDMKEMCLGHKVKNEVEAAYRRTTMLEKRRSLMQQWGDYISKK